MRILGFERDTTACNYYRILSPLSKLDELGMAEVHFLKEAHLGTEEATHKVMWADVIVFQRPATEAWFNFIKLCRKMGKVIVSDYDDDPFNTSPLNPFYQYIGTEPVMWEWEDGTKEWLWSEEMVGSTGNKIFNIERNINHRDMFRLNFKKSDLVTCTTSNLKNEFLKINPNVEVLPNLIDPLFFPEIQLVKKEVRIGWQGSAAHYEDLYFLKPIIKEVLEKNDNVKFVYFGDLRFKNLFKDCDQSKIEWHSWVSHTAYPYKMATLNLDIGLCPLILNQFNVNKSAIKWMEYSALGFMTIASAIDPYAPVIKDGETGVLVNEDHGDWVNEINKYINAPQERKRIAENAKESVLKDHNANTKAHLWIDAYQKAIKGELVKV